MQDEPLYRTRLATILVAYLVELHILRGPDVHSASLRAHRLTEILEG